MTCTRLQSPPRCSFSHAPAGQYRDRYRDSTAMKSRTAVPGGVAASGVECSVPRCTAISPIYRGRAPAHAHTRAGGSWRTMGSVAVLCGTRGTKPAPHEPPAGQSRAPSGPRRVHPPPLATTPDHAPDRPRCGPWETVGRCQSGRRWGGYRPRFTLTQAPASPAGDVRLED
jgi:hypothetical protein